MKYHSALNRQTAEMRERYRKHTRGERSQTQSAITLSREIFTCHLERQDHEDRTHTSVCPGEEERRGRAEGGMRTL